MRRNDESHIRPAFPQPSKPLQLVVFVLFAGSILSACSSAPGDSMVKIQSGSKTLVDVKRNGDDNIQVDIGVPHGTGQSAAAPYPGPAAPSAAPPPAQTAPIAAPAAPAPAH